MEHSYEWLLSFFLFISLIINKKSLTFRCHVNKGEQYWTQIETLGTLPCPRNFHSAAVVKNSMYIHGGKSNGYHADMYRFSFSKKKWHMVTYKEKPPLARYGHTMIFCNGVLYMLGGYDQHGFCCDDLFQFSTQTHSWKKIQFMSPLGAISIGRFHSAVTFYKNKLLVFSGKGADSIKSDLLEYDLNNHTWKRITAASKSIEPTGRWGHTCHAIGDYLYVFGGRDGISHFSDLYCFDLVNLKWKILLPSQTGGGLVPEPRYFHSSVALGHSIYVVAGKNIYDFNFDEMLEWRIATELAPNSHLPKDERRNSTRSQGSDSSIMSFMGTPSNSNRLSGERKIRLKCVFKDEIRIISVSPVITFAEIQGRLALEYGEPNLRIQYEDDEGDLITIRSSANMEEALMFFGDAHRSYIKLLLSSSSFNDYSIKNSNIIYGDSMSSQWVQDMPLPSKTNLESTPNDNFTTTPSKTTLKSHNISKNHRVIKWQSGGLIGEGGFGKVYLAMNIETAELMAVKQVPLRGEASFVDALKREINLVQDLHHPNIIRYYGSEVKDGFLNIFLEYLPGGSITSLLSKFHQLSEKIIISFTKQILQGLEYLHANRIAHRDIKCANLLVDLSGCVKLADFGASKQLADLRSYTEGYMTVTGSPYWMAPEVIQGNTSKKPYGRKADIWSLGAAVIEMVTGKPPFSDLAPIAALFRIGSSSAIPEIPPNLTASGEM